MSVRLARGGLPGLAGVVLAGRRLVFEVRAPRGRRGDRLEVLAIGRTGRAAAITAKTLRGKGTTRVALTVPRSGHFAVRGRIVRRGTRGLAGRPLRLRVTSPSFGLGAPSPLVGLLRARLRRLGYVTGPDRSRYDAAFGRAVFAFQGMAGMPARARVTPELIRRVLAGDGRFRARFPQHGRHAEADLTRRVLVLLDGAKVLGIYHTSAGKRSTPTILGSFRIERKEPGKNKLGMVDSSYFIRGFAVHGYHFVPPFPDSHGCLRVSLTDSPTINRFLAVGTSIDVYRGGRSTS